MLTVDRYCASLAIANLPFSVEFFQRYTETHLFRRLSSFSGQPAFCYHHLVFCLFGFGFFVCFFRIIALLHFCIGCSKDKQNPLRRGSEHFIGQHPWHSGMSTVLSDEKKSREQKFCKHTDEAECKDEAKA